MMIKFNGTIPLTLAKHQWLLGEFYSLITTGFCHDRYGIIAINLKVIGFDCENNSITAY